MKKIKFEATLRIRREAIRESLNGIPTTEIRGIEDFILQVFSNSVKEGTYQGKIIDQNFSLILVTPPLERARCIKKCSEMIKSLGTIVEMEPFESVNDLTEFLDKKLVD